MKHQICRKCLRSCIPAITLAFPGGNRLHWCHGCASDARNYLSHAVQEESVMTTIHELATEFLMQPYELLAFAGGLLDHESYDTDEIPADVESQLRNALAQSNINIARNL